jgi:hypothetical protein
MTRPQATIHALIVGSRTDHRPSSTCPCRPLEAIELMAGPMGRLVFVHRDRPDRLPVRRDEPEPAP